LFDDKQAGTHTGSNQRFVLASGHRLYNQADLVLAEDIVVVGRRWQLIMRVYTESK